MGEAGTPGSRRPYPDLEAIARKCEPFNIETELEEPNEDTPGEPAMLWLAFPEDSHIRLPDGSPEYILWIDDGPAARFALAAPFERYRHFRELHGASYDAMWSETLGAVECELTPCDRPLGALAAGEEHDESVEDVLHALGHDVYSDEDHDPDKRVRFEIAGDAEVSVGPASDPWVVRNLALDNTDDGQDVEVQRGLTLRIEGVDLPDQGRAEEVLERMGNAALFELDRAMGVGLRMRMHAGRTRAPAEVTGDLPARLALEYDREPMSLYWYARTAEEGMPLLAFLAYYQVLEFYFPQYSRRGAIQTLRESLRGLSLDALRDSDLVKVLDAVRVGRRGSFGNEVEQLKATVKQCVNQETLRSFFDGHAQRREFYGSDECTHLSPTRVPISGSSSDWRGDVARRVYEIRNRVVHAKSQHDDLEPLLPFDPEVDLLWHDVELVAFLAREVLFSAARPLRNVASGP